jgi:hypothetical protein
MAQQSVFLLKFRATFVFLFFFNPYVLSFCPNHGICFSYSLFHWWKVVSFSFWTVEHMPSISLKFESVWILLYYSLKKLCLPRNHPFSAFTENLRGKMCTRCGDFCQFWGNNCVIEIIFYIFLINAYGVGSRYRWSVIRFCACLFAFILGSGWLSKHPDCLRST